MFNADFILVADRETEICDAGEKVTATEKLHQRPTSEHTD